MIVVFVGLLGGIACSARFAVLPSVLSRGAVVAEENGIKVMATAQTPVRPCECPGLEVLLVTIQNGTDRLLSVRYPDLKLRTRSGERLAVLPPFDLTPEEMLPMPNYYPYVWSGFQLAPFLAPYYRGFWNVTIDVEPNVSYYEGYYPRLEAITAATKRVRRHALPEGLLEPGGHITGVLYFANRRGDELSTLSATFADAQTDRSVAALEVSLAATVVGG
jgi:hypothetical protein